MGKKIITKNKSAIHDYHIFETFVAGIVLFGTEIKSIRNNSVNLKDSFAKIDQKGEIWLHNAHIGKYDKGNIFNHDERRPRKLLLTKREILKMSGKIKKENYAIVPIELFLQNGYAKVEIALAKGKKLYDKREDLMKKTQNRDIARKLKNF